MQYSRIPGLVSIVVTNFNHKSYIAACLDSLNNQSYKNIELIIIDDASTDNSVVEISNWIETNKRYFPSEESIKLVCLPRNTGFASAVTLGFFLSHGEYIAVQDSDDLSHPSRIEKQVDFLQSHKDISVVGTNYASFEEGHFNPKNVKGWLKYGAKEIKETYSRGGHCVSHGTILFRGTLFDKIGGLTRKLDGAEDYEFIIKSLPDGVDNIPEVLYYYRLHEKQRSKEFYSKNPLKFELDNLRILMVLDSLNVGGTETHVLTLVSELLKKGISVSLLAGAGAFSEEFSKLGCKIYNMDFPLWVIKADEDEFKYKVQIKQILDNEKINLIHCHQSPSGALCIDVAKEKGIPCVFTIHGLYYQDIASDRLHNCSKVISVSEPVFDWLQKYYVNSIVIPNGVDFNNFKPSKSNLIREQLKLTDNSFIVLYASRMAWGKIKVGENVLRVCRDLRKFENMDIHAFILGNGPGFNDIKGLAERISAGSKSPFIHVFGERTNITDFYLNADCVVGTGRVAIEALACQRPVIAAGNQGYFGLITEENIKEAWSIYFADHRSEKINNASFLYEDLKNLYYNRDIIEKNSINCYSWARDNFEIGITTQKILDVYESAFDELTRS